MLIVKNISRILAVSLVIIGFLAGSFLPSAQSSCCCGNSDNCCCCIADETGPIDKSTSISGVCGCEMTEGDSSEFTSLEAQRYTELQNKIEKAESLPRCRESLVRLSPIIPTNPELTRNSGPPIFISISSLLI